MPSPKERHLENMEANSDEEEAMDEKSESPSKIKSIDGVKSEDV